MALEIGKLQKETGKDAIHVPVVSVWCGDAVKQSDRVCFTDDSYSMVRIAGSDEAHHAIVDPFLNFKKRCGMVQILVFLVPGTVTKLTHSFDPNIPNLPKAYVPEPEPEYNDDDEYDSCRGCY